MACLLGLLSSRNEVLCSFESLSSILDQILSHLYVFMNLVIDKMTYYSYLNLSSLENLSSSYQMQPEFFVILALKLTKFSENVLELLHEIRNRLFFDFLWCFSRLVFLLMCLDLT